MIYRRELDRLVDGLSCGNSRTGLGRGHRGVTRKVFVIRTGGAAGLIRRSQRRGRF